MKQNDLRVIKTKKAIRDTIESMILEKDLNKITVKELTEKANIHRKTFYLHYSSIKELFEEIMHEKALLYYHEIDRIDSRMPMEEINKVFFTFLEQQQDFFKKMILSNSYQEITNKIFILNLQHNRNRYNPYQHLTNQQQEMINNYLVNSSLSFYRQWINSGKIMTLDEIIEFTSNILCNGINSIIKAS